jgi:predicted nucleic acid-binding protein
VIVVADTSPIRYLLLIEHIDLLPQLYGRIAIPQRVYAELIAPNAPQIVQVWAIDLPNWTEVKTISIQADLALQRLDPGEQEAILLAQELQAELLLLDDKAGRQAALSRNLSVTGLLGVLDEAAKLGLISRSEIADRLLKTNFRVAPGLLQLFIENDF